MTCSRACLSSGSRNPLTVRRRPGSEKKYLKRLPAYLRRPVSYPPIFVMMNASSRESAYLMTLLTLSLLPFSRRRSPASVSGSVNFPALRAMTLRRSESAPQLLMPFLRAISGM